MRLNLILGLLILSACGAKHSSLKMGKTTRADVVALKGEPQSEEKLPLKDAKMMIYPNDERIQLKGDVVVNRFSNPSGDERLVLWWKHKFKDCQTFETKLPQPNNSHTPPEIELNCPSEGLSVIYTEGSDAVTRVVEHEAK